MSQPTSSVAFVDQSSPSKPPILHARDISPAIMHDFEHGCKTYFEHKQVDEKDHVCKILGCFRDDHIRDWIHGDCDCILQLGFTEFMADMCQNYLDPDWEDNICHTILVAMLCNEGVFWDWFSNLQSQNALLCDTPSYFSDKNLHDKPEASLPPELARRCHDEKVDKELDLHKWAREVKCIDEGWRADLKCQMHITEAYYNKHQHQLMSNTGPPSCSNAQNHYSSNSVAQSTASMTIRTFLPKLMSAKIAELNAKKGCRKCC
ncbi:hypothetical protein L208DRAFT_1232757 [Tricholoma matsutake]|nr:hypothetical protein L208DRAFT_1232757 [Tricholoma matsutake 945]